MNLIGKILGSMYPTRTAPAKQQPPMFTVVPGRPAIELRSYYESFRSYYPDCEPLTKEWFVDHVEPDWVILDCGANIGYYSILFSQLAPAGMVYAFEPTSTFDMLKVNLEHSSATNVVPLRLALGRRTGRMSDAIFRIWGQEPEHMEYDFTTIDDWVVSQGLHSLDCIKIDVDSFDLEVLQGSERTLRQFNPYVVVELNHALSRRNQSVPMALEWMCAQGYKECLCLEHDNYVFRRGMGLQSEGASYPSIRTWLKSRPSQTLPTPV